MDYFIEFSSRINSIEAIFIVLLILALHILALKKSFCNIADPLVLFCIFNTFSIVTTWFISRLTDNYNHIIDITIFNISFFSASILFKAKPNINSLRKSLDSFRGFEADVFMLVLAILTMFSTLVLWIYVGIPFLAEDPSLAKVEMYQRGFGIVRYLHFIAPPVLSLFAMLEIVRIDIRIGKKYLMLIYIFGSAIVAVSAGSKSSLLFLIFNIGTVIYINGNKSTIDKLKKYLALASVFASCIVVFILGFTNEGVARGLILRLFASGDIYFFWYAFDLSTSLSKFNPFDFIIYLLSPFTGMIGITKQEFPVGAIIMNAAVDYPISSLGPNAQLPILMNMYFSKYSYIAAGVFGLVFYYIRTRSHNLIKIYGPSGFFMYTVFYFGSTTFFVDINYYMSLISASLLILIFVYLISKIFIHSKKVIR